MAHDDGEGRKVLPASGHARRRFLMDSALATAGVSAAALLPGDSSAAKPAAAIPRNCPSIKMPMKEVEGKVAFVDYSIERDRKLCAPAVR